MRFEVTGALGRLGDEVRFVLLAGGVDPLAGLLEGRPLLGIHPGFQRGSADEDLSGCGPRMRVTALLT